MRNCDQALGMVYARDGDHFSETGLLDTVLDVEKRVPIQFDWVRPVHIGTKNSNFSIKPDFQNIFLSN